MQHKTFPESLQRRRIQESCRSRQSGKCFHLQQQVNLFRIFAAAENFWHKLLTLLLPRQAAAVLLRKLLNYSSAEALTGSGREKREKEISEFIKSVTSYTMRSKYSSSLRAPGNLNPAPLNHWSWRLRKNIGLWRFRETLATPPQRNTREILSSPLLQFGFSLPTDAGWLILRVDNAVHRF